jgi:hypothetical protein
MMALLLFLIVTSETSVLMGAQQTVSPAEIAGRDNCAQCHVEELNALERSSHDRKAWSLLDHPKAAGFAKAVGVTDIKGVSICTECHGTLQNFHVQRSVLPVKTCESCHGHASGDNGWLTKHYDFGLGRTVDNSTKMSDLLVDRLKETKEHRVQRLAACTEAGMNCSENITEIAKNCLNCHLVPNEKLLNAGHPFSSSFELVRWASGEVRHNFLLDPNLNSEAPTNWSDAMRNGPGRTVAGRKRIMYLSGKLADLEVSLRIRAGVTSTSRRSLGDRVNDRILDIQEELEDIDISELKSVLDAIKEVTRTSIRKITDQDKTIYNSLADDVAKAAKRFVTAHAAGDQLPAEIKVRKTAKGKPYKAN